MIDRVDLLVIGGGINGTGIARDAAGRGLRVALVEQHDLAAHTSSASTKLVHGGLRYLEHFEFKLVHKALAEREIVMRNAAHLAWPLHFVLPHAPHQRPAWMIRAGLFIYDHLARRTWLPASRSIDLRTHPAGAALRDGFVRAFEYADGWIDDARLVVLNARDAAARGALIATRTTLVRARRVDGGWVATVRDADGEREIEARVIVNAAGPYAHDVLVGAFGRHDAPPLRLVRGSHIVVPKRFAHADAYLFQQPDHRVVFAVPYEHDFTLIGTTDHDVTAASDERASEDEIAYLIEAANRVFRDALARHDVVHTFGGIRPLLGERGAASDVTRDYRLDLDMHDGAPLLNVWGGKLTTYRALAEEALDRLRSVLPTSGPAWTRHAPLPGAAFVERHEAPWQAFDRFVAALAARHPRRAHATVLRLARAYGTQAEALLDDPQGDVVAGVPHAELAFARAHEWALNADDFLWRRTKLGLHLDATARERIAAWFAQTEG